MVTRQLTMEQVKSLNLTAAAELVNTAARFEAEFSIRHEGGRVHMGSLIGVLTAATLPGKMFVLEACGPDEEAAMKAVQRALELE